MLKPFGIVTDWDLRGRFANLKMAFDWRPRDDLKLVYARWGQVSWRFAGHQVRGWLSACGDITGLGICKPALRVLLKPAKSR